MSDLLIGSLLVAMCMVIGLPLLLIVVMPPLLIFVSAILSPFGYAIAFAKERHAWKTSIKILVTDDDKLSVQPLLELLKHKKSVIVHYAESGSGALRELGKTPFDLIFMDILMPGLTGIETLHQYEGRKRLPVHQIPVILFTGRVSSLQKLVENTLSTLESPA